MVAAQVEAQSSGESDARYLVGCFVFACVVCLYVYRPALWAPFASDDSFFVIDLGTLYALDWQLVVDAFDPRSTLQFEMMSYGPLYLLVSRLEWALFGANPFPYHLVNVVVHALVVTLLVAVMRQAGIDRTWSALGAMFYALHPANVEAVAWINQLRSILAMAFALGALLSLRRHPALALVLFAASVLSKVSGLFALPVALVLYALARRDPRRAPIAGAWMWGWVVVGAAFAAPNLVSVSQVSGEAFGNVAEMLRNVAAVGARYIWMAATSLGVSAFHKPLPVQSWANLWWLASLPLGAFFVWRIYASLVAGREEAAWWIGAATAYGMIAQFFPLIYPMADRYIYIILPGLLVASLLFWQQLEGSAAERGEARRRLFGNLETMLRIVVVVALVLFAARSSARAALWQHELALVIDSAKNYPHSPVAAWARHHLALEQGDLETAIEELRNVIESNHYQYVDAFGTPALAPHLGHPAIAELRLLAAKKEIERWEERGVRTQQQARALASAYSFVGWHNRAIETLESALRQGGPLHDVLLAELEQARRARAQHRAAEGL